MDDLKSYFRDDLVLGVLAFVCLFGGIFGAVNWNGHIPPRVPHTTPLMRQEQIDAAFETYRRELESTGRDTVIPWVWCPPMTVVGFAGCLVCFIAIGNRNKWFD